jgi:hypothetical protein
VTVRAQFLLFAFAAAAALGAASDRSGSEPLETPSSVRPVTASSQTVGTRFRLSSVAASSMRAETHVTTAISSLDLSKLTMADFGDVEPGR